MAKIAFITARFPFPLNKGDMLRAYNQIRILSKKHDIYLFSLSEKKLSNEQIQALRPYCKEVHNCVHPLQKRLWNILWLAFQKFPAQVAYFYSPSWAKFIQSQVERIQPDCLHFHTIRTMTYKPEYNDARTSLDYMDCFSHGAILEYRQTKNILRKLFLRLEFQRLQQREIQATSQFQRFSIISAPDRASLPVTSENVTIIPNGVDTDIFHNISSAKQYDLLFTGNMGYGPNIHAAEYTIRHIVPLLHQSDPRFNLLIAGISAPRRLKKLATREIIFRDDFEHIRQAFAVSRIMLAPMLISIGMQNKILQAMAMGIPVISSPYAAASIGAEHNVNILIANNASEYVQHILSLSQDISLSEKIVAEGKTFVKESFSWINTVGMLEKLMLHDQ